MCDLPVMLGSALAPCGSPCSLFLGNLLADEEMWSDTPGASSLRLLPARMRPPSEEGGSEGSRGAHRQAELRVREGESLCKGPWGARVGEEPRPWPPGLYALPLCL